MTTEHISETQQVEYYSYHSVYDDLRKFIPIIGTAGHVIVEYLIECAWRKPGQPVDEAYSQIAAACYMNRSTVIRTMPKIEKCRIVSVHRTLRGPDEEKNENNVYIVHTPDKWNWDLLPGEKPTVKATANHVWAGAVVKPGLNLDQAQVQQVGCHSTPDTLPRYRDVPGSKMHAEAGSKLRPGLVANCDSPYISYTDHDDDEGQSLPFPEQDLPERKEQNTSSFKENSSVEQDSCSMNRSDQEQGEDPPSPVAFSPSPHACSENDRVLRTLGLGSLAGAKGLGSWTPQGIMALVADVSQRSGIRNPPGYIRNCIANGPTAMKTSSSPRPRRDKRQAVVDRATWECVSHYDEDADDYAYEMVCRKAGLIVDRRPAAAEEIAAWVECNSAHGRF